MSFGGRGPLSSAAMTKQANQISTNLHTGPAAGPRNRHGRGIILPWDGLTNALPVGSRALVGGLASLHGEGGCTHRPPQHWSWKGPRVCISKQQTERRRKGRHLCPSLSRLLYHRVCVCVCVCVCVNTDRKRRQRETGCHVHFPPITSREHGLWRLRWLKFRFCHLLCVLEQDT